MLSTSFKTIQHPRGPVQHAVAKPFSPRPMSQALPMVSIADHHTLARLQSQGVSFRVSCELPTQLPFLWRCNTHHQHVRLLLDTTAGTSEDLDTAFFEALIRFEQATSMAIHYNGKATPDTLNALCEVLASCSWAPASLELHFRGTSTEQLLSGMQQLLRTRPGMVLICTGSLVISAAIACLQRCTPAAIQLKALKFVGVATDDPHLIECLSQLRDTDLHIDLRFKDASDPDDFITSLLEAGAWAGLQLSCHTSDGRSADLQERLDACRDLHLNRLLDLCMRDGRLDHQKLLPLCQAIYCGGAQLFAWACGIAGKADTEDVPEVPIALKGYWLTLSHSRVAHVVCCNLPADTLALTDAKARHILGLKIDFGDMTDTDPQMQNIEAALQRMKQLAIGIFYHRAATHPFGGWLLLCLRNLPIQRACFDLGGDMTGNSFEHVVTFLSKPSLRVVTCKDMLTTSLLLIALHHFSGSPFTQLKLNVLPEHEEALIHQLHIGTKHGLCLSVHFPEKHVPAALMANLYEELGQKQPEFLVKWLDVSSRTYTMPLDSPLALRLVKRHIATELNTVRKALAVRTVENQYRAAEHVDLSLAKAFVSSIGNSFDGSNDAPPESHAIRSAARTMSAADDVLRNLLSQLEPKHLLSLSSTHKAIRSHAADFKYPLRKSVANWVRSMAHMEWPLENYRTILPQLFPHLTSIQLSDEFLLESLQPPPQASQK